MYVFQSIIDTFQSINPVAICARVFSIQDIKDYLIDAITLRLKEKGETASGIKLRTNRAIDTNNIAYSKFHIEKAQRKWVDLYDRGDFYDSFNIDEKESFFEVSAEFQKGDENIYRNFSKSFRARGFFQKEILTPIYDEYFKNFAEYDFIDAFFEVLSEFLVGALKMIKAK